MDKEKKKYSEEFKAVLLRKYCENNIPEGGISSDLLAKYISGNCTANEKEKVKLWLSTNTENQEYFNSVKAIWEAGMPDVFEWDENRAWLKMKERINKEEKTKLSGFTLSYFTKLSNKRVFRSISPAYNVIRIAAAIVIIIIAVFVYRKYNGENPNTDFNMSFASRGEIKQVYLPDKSIITLNSTSKLRYPSQFGNTREVYLEGEAFFDISHDSTKPFIVHLNNADVRVLGTKFNIKGWNSDKKYEVVVESGKVLFSSIGKTSKKEKVILTTNEMSIMKAGENPTPPIQVKADIQTAWKNGQLLFNKTTLREVISALERKFNVSITVTGESYSSRLLTASFKDEPIELIIKTIGKVLNLNYSFNDNIVNFF
jgi:transmembrane sensor